MSHHRENINSTTDVNGSDRWLSNYEIDLLLQRFGTFTVKPRLFSLSYHFDIMIAFHHLIEWSVLSKNQCFPSTQNSHVTEKSTSILKSKTIVLILWIIGTIKKLLQITPSFV